MDEVSARRVPRAILLTIALGSAGCTSCGHRVTEVRWPASLDDVRLADELAVTAQLEGTGPPLSPAGEPIEPAELPPDTLGVHARSSVFEGLWYAEVVIGDVDPDSALPLVVMLHGRGDRPRVPGGPFGRVPTPMRVVVPRGPWSLGEGYAWARSSVTQNRHDELAADLVETGERLLRLVEHVAETRPTLGTTVVTGFSQGAMLTWTLAVRRPDQVGLAIPLAGWVPPGARPAELHAAPTRSIHGTADPIVRIEPTRDWVEQLWAAGNDVTWLELDGVAHEVSPEMNLQFEEWLEEALQDRAPELDGGLGEAGPDPEPVEPFEPPADVDLEGDVVEAPLSGLE